MSPETTPKSRHDTGKYPRTFLATRDGDKKGDLSRFIEEAVRAHILELSAEQVKVANPNVSEADLASILDEALEGGRTQALMWGC